MKDSVETYILEVGERAAIDTIDKDPLAEDLACELLFPSFESMFCYICGERQ